MIDTTQLTHQKCVPCEGNTAPFSLAEEEAYLTAVSGWSIDRSGIHQISKEIELKSFNEILNLVNKIGALAEEEGHHPNLYLYGYKFLKVELTTHAIKGLSVNDFILAAKIDELLQA